MKELPYLKLFTEARNDPKIRALYKGSAANFWVWFNLFCYSGEQPKRGVITARSLYLVAVEVADGDADLLRNACNAMESLQLVTCNISDVTSVEISIHNFDKWQDGKRPSEQAERVRDRVRKCRENKKKGNSDVNGTESCNGNVTTVTTHVTPYNKEEEEDSTSNDVLGARPTDSFGSHQEAVELAAEIFGNTAANAITRGKGDIEAAIQGTDGRPRWDCYLAALRYADLYRHKPNAAKIRSLNAFCLERAREWIVVGIPADPVAIDPVQAPKRPAEPDWSPPTAEQLNGPRNPKGA